MSIKIKASYTDDRELDEIVRRLHPVKNVRIQPAKGRYKRAYIVPEYSVYLSDLVNENTEKCSK